MTAAVWTKDPLDDSWFEFDFSGWLVTGETIASSTATVSDALTITGKSQSGTQVFVQVSGGRNGTSATISVTITTSASNTYADTKTVLINTRTS